MEISAALSFVQFLYPSTTVLETHFISAQNLDRLEVFFQPRRKHNNQFWVQHTCEAIVKSSVAIVKLQFNSKPRDTNIILKISLLLNRCYLSIRAFSCHLCNEPRITKTKDILKVIINFETGMWAPSMHAKLRTPESLFCSIEIKNQNQYLKTVFSTRNAKISKPFREFFLMEVKRNSKDLLGWRAYRTL